MNEYLREVLEENKRTKDPYLDLGNCGITELPQELYEHTWIETLMISNKYWDSEKRKWIKSVNKGPRNTNINITSAFAKLISLHTLKIGNDFEGTWNVEGYANLEPLIHLTTLDLSYNKLEDASFLANLTSLTTLDLSDNKLEDFSFLANLTSLTTLYLSSNQLEDYSFLANLTSLTTLYLSSNKLEDYSFLANLTSLTTLDLSSNKLEDASFLANLTSLTTLYLRANKLEDYSFLANLTSLTTLYLSYNQLEDASFLANLTSLTTLDLSYNKLEDASFLANLTSLTTLDLSANKLEDASFLANLTSLTSLNLSDNKLEDASFSANLTSLTTLDLSSNKLEDANFLANLTSLTSLNLSSNQLEDYSFLANLTSLTTLYLSSNKLEDASFLANLTSLTTLYLSSNQLEDASFLANLTSLTTLYLSSNKLEDASFLANLTSLTTLDLSSNKLEDYSFLANLTSLTTLDLSSNKLEDYSFLANLTSLTTLDLSSNKLEDASFLANLTSLTTLDLSYNQLEDANFLANLTSLTSLDLRYNQIQDIKPLLPLIRRGYLEVTLNEYETHNKLNLYSNPITSPPIEIVEQGNEAIISYFEQLEDGKDYLYEAKLLIVGEERAGKSTIVEALRNPDFKINSNNQSTEGIDIFQWPINKEKINSEKDFLFNVWDFGGQEIYHATHQFFLTKRSLYLFVTEARKDLRFDDFYYWLNIINTLAGDSPVILVQNKTDQDHKNPNIEEYQELFPQIAYDLQRISCNSEHEDWESIYKPKVDILKENIYKTLKEKKLEGIGDPLPKAWIQVRAEIKELQDQELNHIAASQYYQICKNKGLNKEQALFLSDYFHDLGVFLHFRSDPFLKRIIFINHEWITQAVYNVLDNNKVKDANGRFTIQDLDSIWSEEQFGDKQPELLRLLLNPEFKLCYEKSPNEYLAPQLFDDKPVNYEWRSTEDNLNFHYQYKFMPKGILSQLIVSLHDHIYKDTFWLNGVLFEYKDSRAIVKEIRFGEKKITIQVEGRAKKELLTIIIHKLEEINKSFTNLSIIELFGCNCSECRVSNSPYLFNGQLISKAIRKGVKSLACGESFENITITSLLGNYIPRDETNFQMEHRLQSMNPSFDRLLIASQYIKNEQKNIRRDLQELKTLITRLTEEQSQAVENILFELSLVDESILKADWNNDLITDKIHDLLGKLDQVNIPLEEKADIEKTLKDPEVSIKHKLKLTIPIWIGLKYEGEVELSNKQQIPKSWKEFKALFWESK